MLEPVQIRLPGFSGLYRYTKFGMASENDRRWKLSMYASCYELLGSRLESKGFTRRRRQLHYELIECSFMFRRERSISIEIVYERVSLHKDRHLFIQTHR